MQLMREPEVRKHVRHVRALPMRNWLPSEAFGKTGPVEGCELVNERKLCAVSSDTPCQYGEWWTEYMATAFNAVGPIISCACVELRKASRWAEKVR